MVYVSGPTWMLPVRCAAGVFEQVIGDSAAAGAGSAKRDLDPTLTSGVALQLQKSPVVTVMRPNRSAAPTVTLVGESDILAGDPSCVTVNAGGVGRFVTSEMVPLRAATHVFAATE